MKVGFLLDDHMHRPGGIQEHVRGLYHYLERHGHEAVIFTGGSQYNNNFSERIIQLGASLPVKGSGSWTSIPVTFQSPQALRRLMQREACDVLDVQSPFAPTLSGRLLAQSTAAHVMTFLIHINPGLWLTLASLGSLPMRPALRRFHKRVAVSHSGAVTARALYGEASYTVIPDAISTEEFAQARAKPRLARYNDGRVTLLFVGRLEQRKGVSYLLRAYALLEREHGDQVRLVVAGDGPERDSLHSLATKLGLSSVEFLGYVARSEMPQLFASADLFCAPAVGHESFGRVLIEAMAAGLPIVAFGNAGYAETLSAHPGNLVVPPGDTRALAGAIGAFVSSPQMRAEVSRKNIAGAERYTWERVGAQFIEVYEQALEEKARREKRRQTSG